MAYLKVSGTGTINLTGNYGYNTSTVSGLAAGTTINAKGASWIVSNSANQFPDADTSYLEGSGTINKYAFIVYNAGYGLKLNGGTVWGQVPQTSDWKYTYNNSAAVRVEYAPGVTIDDWRIDKAWDAFRIMMGSDKFLIDDAHLSNIRDDAIENDYALNGTIRDSLFDGVFSGLSLTNGAHTDGSANTVSLQNVFMRSESYLYEGKMTHGSPIKADSDSPQTTPDLRITNSIIAIEDPNHIGYSRLQTAWNNVVESSGNVFLNLSDTPLPSDYPKPPAGFTILQGQVARDYWEKAKAAWESNHDGVGDVELTPLPALPGTQTTTPTPTAPTPTAPTPTEPTPTAPTAPEPTKVISGTESRDKLYGTSGSETIRGNGGNDALWGKGGSDVLTGGAGKDQFIFDTKFDGTFDRISDFNPAEDSIYLSDSIFSKLGYASWSAPKQLSSSWLVDGPGAVAHDSNDFIIYDSNTGNLSYDADGSGAGAPVIFAQLPTGLDLSNGHFFIV